MKEYLVQQARRILNQPFVQPISGLFAPVFSGIGSIIMLHRVTASKEDIVYEDIEFTKEYLEKTINYFIENNYEIVSLDTAYEILNGQIKVDKKFVVFTFDDGYIDNFTLAYPIFKKYNIPFTIYITTSFPDKTAVLWWYALKELINKNQIIKFTINEKTYRYDTSSLKKKVFLELRSLILSVDVDQQKNLFKILFEENGIDVLQYSKELTMSWNQIKTLSEDELVTIGAHTTNHHNLKRLNAETIEKEILDSKERIEFMIESKVEHFAFPYGSQNETGKREIEIAEKINFKTCTTTMCGNLFPEHSKYMSSLPRIAPSSNLIHTFPHCYTNGFFPALKYKFKRVITY